MAKRSRMKPKTSKRLFSRTAEHVHPKNFLGNSGSSYAMRGGIRLT